MYDNYIYLSYGATFIPLIVLAVVSLRAHRNAEAALAALDAPDSHE